MNKKTEIFCISKNDLEKELTISPENCRRISEKQKRAFEINQNPFHEPVNLITDYFFNCEICKTLAPHSNPYRILKSEDNRVITINGILPIEILKKS